MKTRVNTMANGGAAANEAHEKARRGRAGDVDAAATAKRTIAALFAARCCFRAGFAVLPMASPMLLRRLVRGDIARAQRISALIATSSAALDFALRPLLGQASDCFGRRPLLLVTTAIAAACRLWVAMRPSVPAYVVGRLVVATAMGPWLATYRAALTDVVAHAATAAAAAAGAGERGEVAAAGELAAACRARVAQLSAQGLQLANLAGLAATALAGRMDPRGREQFLLSAAFNCAAAAVVLLATRETLPQGQRKPVRWRAAADPTASFRLFFGADGGGSAVLPVAEQHEHCGSPPADAPREQQQQQQQVSRGEGAAAAATAAVAMAPAPAARGDKLRPLAGMLLLLAVPSYNDTHQLFRTARFGWGVAENTRYFMLLQATGMLEPLVLRWLLGDGGGGGGSSGSGSGGGGGGLGLGIGGVTRLHLRAAAVVAVHTALTRRAGSLYCNPFLCLLCQGESLLEDELGARAMARHSHLGQGEARGLLSNLYLPLRLVAPMVYAELFAWWRAAPLWLSAAVHLLNSEVIVPWVFGVDEM
jgi:MFS family permease